MRQAYHSRRDAFLAALGRELSELIEPMTADTGLHALVMGFTGMDELHITKGVRRLGKIVRELTT